MKPLPKAVFLLFLRHPEGITLKYISDYEKELTSIYKAISNREKHPVMQASIEKLCDPSDNSLNEKIARIKSAFVGNIAEEYAVHYYVTGNRGCPMTITLDRKLVTLPKELCR
jgi:hypothetical protein